MEMTVSYTSLLERLGRDKFGQRTGLSDSEVSDIDDCIEDGLKRVYAAHDWSFFRPVVPIATVANQAEYELPLGYESIESKMYYPLGEDTFYPPVEERSDSQIRRWQQRDDETDHPLFFCVRIAEFDPKVGSRKKLILYPTPDDAYTLYAKMTLRPVPIDADNPYPIGGELLAAVITAACRSAAEENLDETESIHEKRFLELLPLAIMADQERSSPTTLGPDAPRNPAQSVSSEWLRAARIGTPSLDGVTL
jgi:hypothetical protein